MPSEFDLIRDYFTRAARHTVLGVGDDGALIAPTPGSQLVVSTDMLVEGTHFFPDADPHDVGWKTLAVNVSDMAAMAATPRWAVLSIALPDADSNWIAAFAKGFFECAQAFDVDVIGGDTTRGPRTLSVTILGEAPPGTALLRSGALPGDDLWISGTPGRAALGLAHLQGGIRLDAPNDCLRALHRPQPRVALGLALRGLAHAALDVSDGLLGDLGHILDASKVGAMVEDTALPWAALTPYTADTALARTCMLAGGDDYELLFCAAPTQRAAIEALSRRLALPLWRIGVITEPRTLTVRDAQGCALPIARRGFDHFL